MMSRTSVIVALVSVAFLATAVQANLLDDGSFDLATSGTQTSNSAWTLTANFPDPNNPTEASAQFQDASWASNDPGSPEHGVWFKSFTGKASGSLAFANLLQRVVAGNNGDHFLSFDARREANFTADSWTASLRNETANIGIAIDLLALLPADGTWKTYTLRLGGVSAGDTLRVTATMRDGEDALVNPQSAFVDNFVLVPEPTSLGRLAILLGLLMLRPKR